MRLMRVNFENSRKSLEHYFMWRKIRGQSAIERVEKRIRLWGLRVLDFGCGYGALTANLFDKGAKVVGCDVDQKSINIAKNFLKRKGNCQIIRVEDKTLPFGDDTFDVIFLVDVIEHVKNPSAVIHECERVLRDGGMLYVEFTPYYSFIGHHLWDVTRFPIHLLPKRIIKKIIFSKADWRSFEGKNQVWKNFSSLNKIRICTFQQLVSNFTVVEKRFMIKYPDLLEINISILDHLGPFKDILTMSFEGIYRKKRRQG